MGADREQQPRRGAHRGHDAPHSAALGAQAAKNNPAPVIHSRPAETLARWLGQPSSGYPPTTGWNLPAYKSPKQGGRVTWNMARTACQTRTCLRHVLTWAPLLHMQGGQWRGVRKDTARRVRPIGPGTVTPQCHLTGGCRATDDTGSWAPIPNSPPPNRSPHSHRPPTCKPPPRCCARWCWPPLRGSWALARLLFKRTLYALGRQPSPLPREAWVWGALRGWSMCTTPCFANFGPVWTPAGGGGGGACCWEAQPQRNSSLPPSPGRLVGQPFG